uniref:Maltoporin n=2 Tax=Macrostomum lignano TaxID=282301 RepID=A0A1I8JJ80_9PLAT
MAFSAPQVHFKKISVGTNGSQNLDENGMCNVDLVAARCRPYYQGNGSYQNPYLKDFHEKKLSLDAKDASVDVDDNTLSGSLGEWQGWTSGVNRMAADGN